MTPGRGNVPGSWTWPTGTRCAGSPACPPSSQDVTEVEYRALRLERVVLVGVWTEGTLANAENSLRELSRLAETAGSVVLDGLVQRRGRPDPATYVGAGKARELADVVAEIGADTVICDGELTPGQLRSLEGVVKVKVVDRTALILDIFAQHARSKEGKAQVELAQLEYLLPRLRGWGESLTRQAGGRRGGRWRHRRPAGPARPRSRRTGGGSGPGSPSCAARSPGCPRAGRCSAASGAAETCLLWPSPGTRTPGSRALLNAADRGRRAGRRFAVRHPGPGRAAGPHAVRPVGSP